MICKIRKIIDEDTLEIEPAWVWNDCSGNTIKLDSETIPAKQTIEELLNEAEIELRYPILLENGSLACEIFIDGENIKDRNTMK
jgi:hypothetical protein